MRRSTRLVVAGAALLLLLAYLFPLWRIRLEAPQYPEGIGLRIQINTIEGATPHDLQNINGLNHYVGMARIEPDSFAELRYMPWILGGLVVLGLMTAAAGRRWLLYLYATVFAAFAAAGLADFYRWEYEYGHNLDPSAAIKVPGLSYQPPLIGAKKLLNFTAHSWPGIGGWLAIGVFAVVAVAAFYEARHRRSLRDASPHGEQYTSEPGASRDGAGAGVGRSARIRTAGSVAAPETTP